MKNIKFNLDSLEASYGENVLTSVVQIAERIDDLTAALRNGETLNDYDKKELTGRLDRILDFNTKIQRELQSQSEKLKAVHP